AQVDVVAAHRVLAPGFGKTPQQLFIAGDEEDHFALDAASSELIDQLRNRCDLRGRVACVQADRRAFVRRLGTAYGVGNERLEQRRRNIVDAIKPQVFEHVQGNALAGAGKTAEEES